MSSYNIALNFEDGVTRFVDMQGRARRCSMPPFARRSTCRWIAPMACAAPASAAPKAAATTSATTTSKTR